jgi:hypothetical protein
LAYGVKMQWVKNINNKQIGASDMSSIAEKIIKPKLGEDRHQIF